MRYKKFTPFLMAFVQLLSLGSIPPPINPSDIRLSASEAVILEINDDGFITDAVTERAEVEE